MHFYRLLSVHCTPITHFHPVLRTLVCTKWEGLLNFRVVSDGKFNILGASYKSKVRVSSSFQKNREKPQKK